MWQLQDALIDTGHLTFLGCLSQGMGMVSRPTSSRGSSLRTGGKPELARCGIPQHSQAVLSMRLCTHTRARTHAHTHTYVHTSKQIIKLIFSLGKKYIYITAMAHPGLKCYFSNAYHRQLLGTGFVSCGGTWPGVHSKTCSLWSLAATPMQQWHTGMRYGYTYK